MSFEPLRFLHDQPRLDPKNPKLFEQYVRELSDFVKIDHIKQRQLGYGLTYDEQDRVKVPLWYLWVHT